MPLLFRSMSTNNGFSIILNLFKKIFRLEIEFVKLTLAEKMIILFSVLALSSVAFVIVMCAMLFISIGAAKFLAFYFPDYMGYMLLGVLYLLLLILLFSFKRILIINPISRMISKLVINPPK